MGLFTGELLHMGIGDVTVSDIEQAGKLVTALSSAKIFPKAHPEPVEATSERASDGFQKQAKEGSEKAFSTEQELQFIKCYQRRPNINECLREMHLGTGYYASAVRLLERHNMRDKPQKE
jgi:hypothetical protein